MTPLEKFLADGEALEKAATPGWRAGRPDMQSYDGATFLPYKALYCDEVEKQWDHGKKPVHEAGRIYGENSVNDSQFFADARTRVARQREIIRVLVEALEVIRSYEYLSDPEDRNKLTRHTSEYAGKVLAEAEKLASTAERIALGKGEAE